MSESSIRNGDLHPTSQESTETREPSKKDKKKSEREVGGTGKGSDSNDSKRKNDASLEWNFASIGPLITQVCLSCASDMFTVLTQGQFWGPDWVDEIRWACKCGFRFKVERLT